MDVPDMFAGIINISTLMNANETRQLPSNFNVSSIAMIGKICANTLQAVHGLMPVMT